MKKFLLYNATLSSSALDEHLFLAVRTYWLTKHGRLLLLSESSWFNICVGKCNSYYSISLS